MAVLFSNLIENTPFRYSAEVKVLIGSLLKREKKKLGEISIVFTSNNKLLEINKTFLKHNYYTDVITFNNGIKDIVAGDVMISVEQVRENAIKYGTTFERELIRVIIHGILHLLGYDDAKEEEREGMRSMEDSCLGEFDESKGRTG